jgi:hypothetical protein
MSDSNFTWGGSKVEKEDKEQEAKDKKEKVKKEKKKKAKKIEDDKKYFGINESFAESD